MVMVMVMVRNDSPRDDRMTSSSIVPQRTRAGQECYYCTIGELRRYFQHAHFIPIVGVGKRGEY